MYRLLTYFLFFILMHVSCTDAHSQDSIGSNGNNMQREVFDDLVAELDFSDTKQVLSPREFEREEPKPKKISPGWASGLRLGGSVIQSIGILLICIVVIVLLYYLFSGIKLEKDKIKAIDINLENIEDIHEVNADDLYEKALIEGDFRLAIRMQFIKILQKLSETEFIKWLPDKTNRDYIRELRGTHLHVLFKNISMNYEWVWYGNTHISEDVFHQLNPQFSKLHDNLIS